MSLAWSQSPNTSRRRVPVFSSHSGTIYRLKLSLKWAKDAHRTSFLRCPIGWILSSFTGEIMCASRKFFSEWVHLWQQFLYCFRWWGEKGKIIKLSLKAGHQWPASETPFKWRFAGGWMMADYWMLAWIFKGSGAVLLKQPYLCDFSKAGLGGSAHGDPWWSSFKGHQNHYSMQN